MPCVTRAFFEIIDFFSKNVGKNVKKAKIVQKNENSCDKIQVIAFLLLNILDQNFHNCGNSGHTTGAITAWHSSCWIDRPTAMLFGARTMLIFL